MAKTPQSRPATRRSRRPGIIDTILTMIGGVPDEIVESVSSPEDAVTRPSAVLDETELFGLLKQGIGGRSAPSTGDIAGMLAPLVQQGMRQSESNMAQHVMTPDLTWAMRIWVTSILAPNDMQINELPVVVTTDDVRISPEAKDQINELLTAFMNRELRLSSRLKEWLEDILFNHGSKAITVIPQAEIRKLMQAELNPGNADSKKVVRRHAYGVESLCVGGAGLLSVDGIGSELSAALENVAGMPAPIGSTSPTAYENEFTELMTNIREALGESVGANCELVSFNSSLIFRDRSNPFRAATEAATEVLRTSGKKYRRGKQKVVDVDIRASQNTGLVILDANADTSITGRLDNIKQGDVPVLIEWPANSVIPICINGNPSDPIGYYVLVDNSNNPVDPTDRTLNPTYNANHQAIAGATAGFNKQIFRSIYGDGISDPSGRWNVMSTTFSIALKQLLEKAAQGNTDSTVTIGEHNAVASCMLFQLMRKRKIKLVYVPEPLMIYYKFMSRTNGTGKSLVEDVETILTLRGVGYIAMLYGLVRNAVRDTVISFDVAENDAYNDLTKIMGGLEEIYAAKHMLPLSSNPGTVMDSLARNSIRVAPKGLRSDQGVLNIEVEEAPGRSNTPIDSSVLEEMDRSWKAGIGIPASAINALSENEYMRTGITQHLFMSNVVRQWQQVLDGFNSKLLGNYVAMCDALRKEIKRILHHEDEAPTNTKLDEADANTGDDAEEKQTNGKKDAGSADISDADAELEDMVQSVIDNLHIVLPAPDVAVTKSKFEDIEAYIRMVQSIIDINFNEEQAAGNDARVNAIRRLKHMVMIDMIKAYIDRTGCISVLDVPDVVAAIEQYDGRMIDATAMIDNFKEALTRQDKLADSSAGASSDTWNQ